MTDRDELLTHLVEKHGRTRIGCRDKSTEQLEKIHQTMTDRGDLIVAHSHTIFPMNFPDEL